MNSDMVPSRHPKKGNSTLLRAYTSQRYLAPHAQGIIFDNVGTVDCPAQRLIIKVAEGFPIWQLRSMFRLTLSGLNLDYTM